MRRHFCDCAFAVCNGDCKFIRVGENTIISKKALSVVLCSMFVCIFAFGQTAQSTDQNESNSTATINALEPESAAARPYVPSSDVVSNTQNNAGRKNSNPFWQFIKLILVLALVIACIYGLVWLLKKFSSPAYQSDPYLKRVSSVALAPGKSVCIVSTPSQAFMVGVTDNSINLIGEITDKELIDAMNLNAERQGSNAKPKDFSSMLGNFFEGGKVKNAPDSQSFDAYFENAGVQAAERLREKREEIYRNNQPEDF